jgi:hypothetical protein
MDCHSARLALRMLDMSYHISTPSWCTFTVSITHRYCIIIINNNNLSSSHVSEDDSASTMLEKEEQDDYDTQLHTGVAVVVVEREALSPYIHDQRTVLLRRGLRVMNRCVGKINCCASRWWTDPMVTTYYYTKAISMFL